MAAVNNGVCIANDIIEVQIMGKLYGDWNMIVTNWRSKQTQFFTQGPREHLQGLCTFFASNVVVHQVFRRFRWRRVIPLPVTDYLEFDWTGTTGAGSGHAMPSQVSALWRIQTGLTAPAGRGRFYLPGVPLDSWSNNNYTLGAYSVKDGLKSQIEFWFKQGGASEHIELGVRSRQGDGTAWNPMKTMSYASYPVVQRSRRPSLA